MIIKIIPPKDNHSFETYTDIRKLSIEAEQKGAHYCEITMPELPGWTDKTYSCGEHKVNLFKNSCTCEDYKNRSLNYDEKDIRRCCKHIYYKIINSAAHQHIPKLFDLLLKNTALFNAALYYKAIIKDKDVYFSFNPESNWVGIIAPNPNIRTGDYFSYAFHPIHNKWTLNNLPGHSEQILYWLHQIIRFELPYKHPFLDLEAIKKTW